MLRVIAFATMAIDHIGAIFFPQFLIFRIIGRLAFPLFAYGVAQGYYRTRNFSNYSQRILVLGLISQPIFHLLFKSDYINICFSLLLGLLAIYTYDKVKKYIWKILGIGVLLFLAYFLKVEYGIYGVLMILFFYIFRNNPWLLIFQALLVFSYVLLDYARFLSIFALPAFFLAYYFKKYDFRINRAVQYLFYPVHLLIIYLIYIFKNFY